MNPYEKIKTRLTECGRKFVEITNDNDFSNRVLHAFEKYFWGIGENLQGKIGYDIGAGKGAALIAAQALGVDFMVGLDRSFDEFSHDGYQKLLWKEICEIYAVDPHKSLFLKGDIPNTAFKKESFDFVSLIDVIEHVPTPDVFINYAIEHLSEGGMLILDTCPLYYSPVGHHLFSYFDRTQEAWMHLRNDFDQLIINKNIPAWDMDRFHELNKCTYEDIKKTITQHHGHFKIDECTVNEELVKLYQQHKSNVDPYGTLGQELLCREWVCIFWQKAFSTTND